MSVALPLLLVISGFLTGVLTATFQLTKLPEVSRCQTLTARTVIGCI